MYVHHFCIIYSNKCLLTFYDPLNLINIIFLWEEAFIWVVKKIRETMIECVVLGHNKSQ